VGVAGEIAAGDHEVQLLVVFDRVVGDRTTVRALDHERQLGPVGALDDRGAQVERVAARTDRQAAGQLVWRRDGVGVVVGGVIVGRLVPGRGLRTNRGADEQAAAQRQPEHDAKGAELHGGRSECHALLHSNILYL
jgi:hypothetical protein